MCVTFLAPKLWEWLGQALDPSLYSSSVERKKRKDEMLTKILKAVQRKKISIPADALLGKLQPKHLLMTPLRHLVEVVGGRMPFKTYSLMLRMRKGIGGASLSLRATQK